MSSRRQLLAIGLALLLAFALTCAVSREPLIAFHALLTGAMPEIRWSAEAGFSIHRLTRLGTVLDDTVTLTLLGLAVLIGFRARQFSMGADGQFFLAALAAAVVSVYAGEFGLMGPVGLLLAALAAMAVGFAWGALAGVLKACFEANEIVTTLMLNVVALQIYRMVITYGFNDPAAGFLVTPQIAPELTLPDLLLRPHVSAAILLVPLAVAAAWFLLERTTVGYELRLFGESPAFARHSGLPVRRTVVLSMALGGAFAGLAGLQVSNGLLKRLPADFSPGLGFEGLVVALLARNNPKAVPWAALLYAYLKAGAQAMERSSDVSREMVLIIQALIVLFVVCERLRLPAVWRWRR